MSDDTLLDRALSVGRAIAEALESSDLDTTEVRQRLRMLSSRMDWLAFYYGPFDAEGVNWQGKIHAMGRTVQVSRGRQAVRKALGVVRRELAPLTGAANQRDCFV